MNIITSIGNPEMKLLRNELDALLKTFGEKHGITADLGKGRYAGPYGSFELKLAVKGADGTAKTKEMTALEQLHKCYGLTAEDIKKPFKGMNGHTYTLVGLVPRSPKFPFLGRCEEDGVTYKLTEQFVKICMGVK